MFFVSGFSDGNGADRVGVVFENDTCSVAIGTFGIAIKTDDDALRGPGHGVRAALTARLPSTRDGRWE